jgi:zinc and cadmium transporter
LVGLAVGALFGDALIHLLPETFSESESLFSDSLLVLGGILIFFVMEKFLRWRHCHVSPTATHHLHPVVTLNLTSEFIHNLIDGMLIAASYAVSIPLGWATTLAIAFHEIPQEMGDFGVLIHGGLSAKRALVYNYVAALAAVLGALLVLILGTRVQGLTHALIPVTAGGFLYIAGSDLIPELQHDVKVSSSMLQFILILLGIGLMAMIRLIGV